MIKRGLFCFTVGSPDTKVRKINCYLKMVPHLVWYGVLFKSRSAGLVTLCLQVEFVYVDNLVHAHILASIQLHDRRTGTA